MLDLNEQVVVITGGCGQLGSRFVKSVAESNGIAIIADVDKDRGQILCDSIKSDMETARVEYCDLDITSKESILSLVSHLDDKYGKINALVNNAYPRNDGYGRHFFDVEYEDFCENLNLHVGGYFLASQQFAKYFSEQQYGNIVTIASIYGVVPPRFQIYEGTEMSSPVEYAVIKSGIIHLMKYMTKYLKGRNIRVNTISPGGIFDHQPSPFLGKYKDQCANKGMLDPDDLQGALLFLLSDASKYVNGQNLIVDDGFSL